MPKSSASSSVSTSAAQLMATNGPLRRRLTSWICRATSSFPPRIRPPTSREIRRGQSLDRRAQSAHDVGGSDDRRRGVATGAMAVEQARARELGPRSLDLEDKRADVRGRTEHLEIPVAEAASRIECRFKQTARRRIAARNFERNRLDPAATREPARPPAVRLAQLDGTHRDDPLQHFLERAAHQRDVRVLVQEPREAGQHLGERLTTVALAAGDRLR
jgi:hypothetical protein